MLIRLNFVLQHFTPSLILELFQFKSTFKVAYMCVKVDITSLVRVLM